MVWILFSALIFLLLALDLGVFHKKDEKESLSTALWWSAFWISLGLAFGGFLYLAYKNSWFELSHARGAGQATLEYYSAYLVEKSLSLDNIFVMVLIFTRFQVPAQYQHRVLFWGILGAIVLRGIMIAAGTAMVNQFSWTFYFFGALLIFVALRMLFEKDDDHEQFETMWIVRAARKVLPITSSLDGHRFTTRQNGEFQFTRLFLVLLVVEMSDVMFAIDSIPACFAVTTDPFIVFSSNVFAILGLRSLYFALADLVHRFQYLKYSLVILLCYVGVKMLVLEWIHIPTYVSLIVIAGLMVAGVVFSLALSGKDTTSSSDDNKG